MKQAYVSLVTYVSELPTGKEIRRLQRELEEVASEHEVVVVVPDGSSAEGMRIEATPEAYTVVQTSRVSGRRERLYPGLGRAVGDFVIEWQGPLDVLTREVLNDILEPTDGDKELVEIEGGGQSRSSEGFYKLANLLRPSGFPIRKTVGRVFSRRALSALLIGPCPDYELTTRIANLPLPRVTLSIGSIPYERMSGRERIAEGLRVLLYATRLASVLPLALALVFATFALGAALYALTIFVVRGETPEGWTTLMVLVGLGQAVALVMLGLIWLRLDIIRQRNEGADESTSQIVVVPPEGERLPGR